MIPVRYNWRSLLVRRTTTAATCGGMALVVFVFASALMLSEGVRGAYVTSGSADVAIVLRQGSRAELNSSIETSQVNAILTAPGVATDSSGAPIGSAELVSVQTFNRVGEAGKASVQLRGITPGWEKFRPELRVVAGRMPRAGTDECMIGQRLRGRFHGLDLGQSFEIRKNRPTTVVGVFEAAGSAYESEAWLDLDALRAASGRKNIVSSVRVKLTSPSAFPAFRSTIESNQQFGEAAFRETAFFEAQSEGIGTILSVLATLISVFFAASAMCGAMITMYAAVANRRREIGTLRALGFPRLQVLSSFLLESMFLGLGGGIAGTVASLAMAHVRVPLLNSRTFSEVVFTFHPTVPILGEALGFAMLMGLAGGLLPAVRATRIPPVVALRG